MWLHIHYTAPTRFSTIYEPINSLCHIELLNCSLYIILLVCTSAITGLIKASCLLTYSDTAAFESKRRRGGWIGVEVILAAESGRRIL